MKICIDSEISIICEFNKSFVLKYAPRLPYRAYLRYLFARYFQLSNQNWAERPFALTLKIRPKLITFDLGRDRFNRFGNFCKISPQDLQNFKAS